MNDLDLAKHPLLSRMTDAQREAFLQIAEREDYKPGEVVVREGDLGDSLYLILEGEAEVFKSPPGGTAKDAKETRLALLGPGEFFGEMTLVEPTARSASVRCLTAARLVRLSHAVLTRELERDPKLLAPILVAIIRALSQRLRTTSEILVGLKSGIERFYHLG
jgi:CRP/FNR family transcriptional regulator, cyclic AMP receptor protein